MFSSFWDEKYWLPRNASWDKLPPNFYDLIYPIYFSIPILIFRILLESFFGISVGVFLGVIPRHERNKRIFEHLFGGFARYTRSKRVLECMFRCVCYLLLFFYGLFVLWDKPWLMDIKQCWIGYPYHPVDSSVCWTINFVRVGTLVLISHDISDIILEAGKLVRYYGSPSYVTNSFFFVFLVSWFATRLGYFPFVLIRSGFQDAAALIQPDYNIYNIFQIPFAPRFIILMIFALLCLHVFWTVIIMRIVIRSIVVGEAADVRSDSEEEAEKETIAEKKKLVKTKKERDATSATKKTS
uniref:TLC domain-containing protein n=1 Tax=Panagrolaimus sp. ES5 TaxID=591445 RepID=A0AC34GPZ2_9BILA